MSSHTHGPPRRYYPMFISHAELYFHPEFSLLNDAAFHQSCIDSWAERDAFVAFFNSEIGDALLVDRHGHVRYRRSWLTELHFRRSPTGC